MFLVDTEKNLKDELSSRACKWRDSTTHQLYVPLSTIFPPLSTTIRFTRMIRFTRTMVDNQCATRHVVCHDCRGLSIALLA